MRTASHSPNKRPRGAFLTETPIFVGFFARNKLSLADGLPRFFTGLAFGPDFSWSTHD